MSRNIPKTARFPGRVDARRKVALAAREKDITKYNRWLSTDTTNVNLTAEEIKAEKDRAQRKLEIAQSDVASLKKSLRIKE
jgi:hypothetical protein